MAETLSTSTARNARNMEIANTIRNQVGGKALFMLGAKNLLVVENGLRFSVRGSKKANTVQITLRGDDTYTVRVSKVIKPRFMSKTGRWTKGSDKAVVECEGAYVDMLHGLIREGTGLATRLF